MIDKEQTLQEMIRTARTWIAEADALLITAGAGMGVDSGLPDFRGKQGLWRTFPALKRFQVKYSEAASPAFMKAHPEVAWGFFGKRLISYREVVPHNGFADLLKLGSNMRHGYFVYTSNIDGQFQKALFDPERIVERHGSIHLLQCFKPCRDEIWGAADFIPDIESGTELLRNAIPLCPHCGGMARPNVLLFNDYDWIDQRVNQQMEAFERWLPQVERGIIIEIGAGKAIPRVRNLSDGLSAMAPWRLIRINPENGLRLGKARCFLPMRGREAIARLCGKD